MPAMLQHSKPHCAQSDILPATRKTLSRKRKKPRLAPKSDAGIESTSDTPTSTRGTDETALILCKHSFEPRSNPGEIEKVPTVRRFDVEKSDSHRVGVGELAGLKINRELSTIAVAIKREVAPCAVAVDHGKRSIVILSQGRAEVMA